jgi:hypothetical protein
MVVCCDIATIRENGISRVPCTLLAQTVNFPLSAGQRIPSGMLISRDYVGYMATEVVKKLIEGELIETKTPDAVALRVRQAMNEEINVEDRISEEAREILIQHQDEMRRTGVSYQDMFKKVKAQIARDRKLVLR